MLMVTNRNNFQFLLKVVVAMFNYMTTDFSTVEMLGEEEIEAEGNTFVIKVVFFTISVLLQTSRSNGWITWDYTPFSTVFQSYQDNKRLIMKGCVHGRCRLRRG